MKLKFQNYIEQYGQALTKLCTSLCNNFSDAQDLYQSTWEKAIKKIKSYDNKRPFDKWLFSICVNSYRDSLRRFDRKKILHFNSQEEQSRFFETIPDFADEKDDYIALHTAIKKLKPDQREVIVLYYFRDFTFSELSEILGIPEGTVKSRLHSALSVLRKELNYE